jgi:hypothetical protein
LLYARHCPGAVASISEALRSAGLVGDDPHIEYAPGA